MPNLFIFILLTVIPQTPAQVRPRYQLSYTKENDIQNRPMSSRSRILLTSSTNMKCFFEYVELSSRARHVARQIYLATFQKDITAFDKVAVPISSVCCRLAPGIVTPKLKGSHADWLTFIE